METELISNQPLPDEIKDRIESLFANEPPLLTIVGDLGLSGTYSLSALAVNEKKIVSFDVKDGEKNREYFFSDILSAESKRLYGNVIFYVYLKGEIILPIEMPNPSDDEKTKTKKRIGTRIEIFRSSYSTAPLCDAVAEYINSLIGFNASNNTYSNTPKPSEDLLPSVKAAFKKSRSFCPKCGRKLRSPEAQCLKCGSKKRVINRLLKYLRPKRTLLVIGLILSVFSTILALTPPYMNKILLDDVLVVQEQTSHENAEQNNFSSDETDEQIAAAVRDKKLADLYVIVALLAAIFLLHRLMSSVQGYLFRIVSNTFSNVFKKDVFAKAQYLAMNFYDKTTTGSVMNRISGDTSNIQGFVMQLARDVIVQLFTMIGIIGFMFVMDWRLTLISLTPVPVLVLLSRRYGHLIWPKFRRLWRRSASISGTMTDSIPGIRVIKTFSGEERSINKYGQHIDDYQKVDLEIARIAAVYPTMIGFLVSIGSLAIWLIGGTWVIESNGLLTLGTLVAFIAYTGQFYGPVNFFLGLNESYNNTIVSMEKVMEILDADPESDYGHSNKLKRIEGKIEFIDVNFSFDRSKKVINNACFVIEPGDVVGIVGTTGAGKSTLINLLMRFYEDYEGEILIDGINIKDIDMSYFRSQIGYVQQEPMMFRDTVYNNIAYADPTAHVEQVLAAAEIANAHHFISKFPDGYDTFLGERGVGLSGGEKQRVSIARAVLRNPSILMFDEATSAVDSETEKLIQEAIEQMIAGRTTLMIAHRLSTLRKANKIIVVDGGNIIEFGTPEELMEKQGKYYKLIQIQTMSEQVTNMKREERFE